MTSTKTSFAAVVLGKYSGKYKATGRVFRQTSRMFGRCERLEPSGLCNTPIL